MRFLLLLMSLGMFALPAVSACDGIPLDRLTISGQVLGEHGAGVAGVRVWVNGEDYETLTDAQGNYELFIPLHELGNFKSKTKIRIKAKDARKTYQTTTRQAVLAIDIKRESRKGKEHCQIRGNEGRLVRVIGEAINAGEPELHVQAMQFMYPHKIARRLTMKAKSVVIMGTKKSTASMAQPAAQKRAVPSKVAAGAAAGAAAGTIPSSAGASAPSSIAPSDAECECRIIGTVEIHRDHQLSDRLQVQISLAEAFSVRDTVELFMGSPRAFELNPPRCAEWTLNVVPMSKRDFTIVSVDGNLPVRCERGGLQQLRIVLAPR